MKEKTVNEHSFEFKEWRKINEPKYKAGHLFEGLTPPTTIELLEIYKKEKGL
jgi:hypothetical protein